MSVTWLETIKAAGRTEGRATLSSARRATHFNPARQLANGARRGEDTAALPAFIRRLAMLVGVFCLALSFIDLGEAAEPGPKAIPIARIRHSGTVDFEREILPILKNNCLACHNETKPKGGLVLETPQSILKGGDAGPAVVPKKPAESLLLKVAAHQDPELIMPPPDNKVAAMPLRPDQLGLVQRWIEQGAKGQVRPSAPIAWQPIPQGLNAIYAVALTRDGQFAACGRANQIFVYHLPTGRLAARLNDPLLEKTSNAGAAHRDTINSLVFSPDGELLASGGYRDVKLWRRAKPADPLPAAGDVAALIRSGNFLAAAITNGELRLLDTNGTLVRTNAFPKTMAELNGDSRALFVVEERGRELTFAQSEIDYRKSALKTAESNQVAALTRKKTAADTNAALAEISNDKATAVTNAVAGLREAESAIRDLGPEVSNLVDAFFSAEKEFTNATALAKAARDGADKAKVEQLAVSLISKSNLLAEAKAALEQLPAETKATQKLATEKLVT
ncbi:MAG TPA: c-type cytochrome domain-containing protein, partial [Methylomirabilota bacterium]|nr:c-type cytochrome domain-containing protein [Methylomirabilota bacterium]